MITASLVVLPAGVILLALVFASFNSPPVSLAKLERLHTKMSTNEVRQLLGRPSSIYAEANPGGPTSAKWAYSSLLSWPIVYVYFNENGNYERHVYDH